MQALLHLYSYQNQLHEVSESQFDGLVSVEFVTFETNHFPRVPGLRNMRSLRSLLLLSNKITMIAPGDFAGATRLVLLSLAGNSIVSVATEAFANLAATRVKPLEFDPKNADGSQFTTGVGIGACC